MIKIKGRLYLSGDFEVELDMTEEEYDNLSQQDREDYINDSMNWKNWLDIADNDSTEIYDVEVE